MNRALATALALTFLLALPVAASGHERHSAYSTAFASYFGEGEPVGLLGRGALAEPAPLEGEGENMRIVANLPLSGTTSDIELAGDYAYIGSYGLGMVVVDISNPLAPKQVGLYRCGGGSQFDVQLQPGANPKYAVVAFESPSTTKECHKGDEGFALVDISDPTAPKEVAFVGQEVGEGGVEDGAHNTTMDWPYLYVDQYQPTHGPETGQLDVFDLRRLIANPMDREPLSVLQTPGGGNHDMQVDHRPDGKVIGYGAAIGFTYTFDLSNPREPKLLQRFSAGEHGVGISHGLEPNFDRTVAIESDEYGGGSGVGACGGGQGQVPPPGGILDQGTPGALHFLKLNTEGDAAGQITETSPGKADQLGAFNIPIQNNPSENEGCTAHVFWQAPDEDRLVIAWYGRGVRIVDFTEPDKPIELGHFVATGADTWSAKPHRGYIFAGDIARGLDVYEYTGENGGRWPKTAGPAEVQRERYQGASKTEGTGPSATPTTTPSGGCPTPSGSGGNDGRPTLTDSSGSGGSGGSGSGCTSGSGGAAPSQPTAAPASASAAAPVGGYRFLRTVRVRRGTRRTVVFEVRTTAGKRLAAVRYRLRGNRRSRAVLRASVGGAPARYTYRIRAGKKVIKRGAFTVKATSKTRVPGATAAKLRAVKRAR